ncbi:hypothetical protein BDA96_03G363600 [Sorghum bicolor]|uniref:Proline-rich family protein n=1 Tax=Sorghum bicolor TaxID=4558 RepID=A0A921RGE3_SORBI|nr:hypothetical protein BDA96_03G363600 [Sorghum bicolor]
MEDLLNTEIGKNDYDWLLTPPGTPRVPALDAAEKAPPSTVTKRTVNRSSSTTRASRLSTSETENGHSTFPTRPARSISVSRRAVQSTPMSSNSRSSVLSANISSVSSRPTTPSKRTATLTASKASVLSSRPVPTRSSTPVKARLSTPTNTRPSTPVKNRPSVSNSMTNSVVPKNMSAQSSRSSTPTSRSRTLSSSSSSSTSAVSRPSSSSGKVPAISRTSSSSSTVPSVSRSSSRSSTPTRQPVMRSSTPSAGRISGSNNMISNGRPLASSGRSSAPSSAPSSRPSSPNTRTRAPVRPLDIPDFPSDTPPNLRTKLPERPLSTGRVRPGITSGVRSTPNAEPVLSAPVKKMSVPAITRSKFSDIQSKTSLTNGHQSRPSERSLLDGQTTRTSRSVTAADNGFGRTISRKSLDMAIRHMDIRQNLGGIRGTSLFPHSIRSTTTKGRPARTSDPGHSVSNGDRYFTDNGSSNGHFSGDSSGALSHNGGSSIGSPDRETFGTKEVLSELDIYANSRYEAMLLKEDTKNMSWLHNVDDKSDQSPVFDHRFEPLPEPFGPL